MPAREADLTADYDRLAEIVAQMTPAQLEAFALTLAPADLAVLEDVMGRLMTLGWRADPGAMGHHLTGGEYKQWAYIRLLARKLVEAVNGEDPRQVWNIPSQYGKTSLLCTYGVPWILQRDPTLRVLYVTYDADKAVEEGGKARDLIEEHPELGVRLRPDRRARGMWRTSQGGGLYAVGIYGGIVGYPADVVLLDDLMSGWQAAHSAAQRKAVWAIYRSQIRLRIQSQRCAIVLSGTRWHEDDPAGRALNPPEGEGTEQWTHIRLPALAEEGDLLGRAPGEPLEPERFPLSEVLAREAVLGPYLAAALEAQRPSPEAGNELLREWFQLEHVLPSTPAASLSSWDLKLKNREAGDFVVGQAWWRVAGGYWLMDQLRGQWDHGTTADAIALLAVRHPEIQQHVVEAAGSADEVIPQLRMARPGHTISDKTASKLGMSTDERIAVEGLRRRGMSGLVPQPPRQSKEVRARAFITGAAAAGDIHLPADAYWAPAVLEELAAFPNGSHDDIVDAMSQALSRLAHGPSSFAATSGQRLPTASPGSGRRRLPTPGRR